MYQLLKVLVIGYVACFRGEARKGESGFKLLVSCVTKVLFHETIDLIPDVIKTKYVPN